MAIYARKKEGDYTVCPEGLYQAVCVDVFDLGLKDYGYGPQPKIEITWQLEERDPKTNKRYLIFTNYTPSLHEKSRLRPMLEAWRGKKFTKDEEREFDQSWSWLELPKSLSWLDHESLELDEELSLSSLPYDSPPPARASAARGKSRVRARAGRIGPWKLAQHIFVDALAVRS